MSGRDYGLSAILAELDKHPHLQAELNRSNPLAPYGEQGVYGLAAQDQVERAIAAQTHNRPYGEQGADTDGTAMESVFWLDADGLIAELQARIARKEVANEALTKRVLAQDAKMAAMMADMRSLRALADERQAECKRLSDLLVAQEEKSREAVVTDSEKAADQMRQDILGGKIDKAGRKVVRDACDKMDAPKTGRDASNDALGNISRRGGW